MTDPVLPPELLARLCEFGRLTHVEPATGGAANMTFFARLDATAVVVKVATADDRRMTVRREGRLLPFLHDAELPVPAVLAVIDDPFPGFVALVLERLPGVNGLAALSGAGAPAAGGLVVDRAAELGRLAQRVHCATLSAVADRGEFDLAGGPGAPTVVRAEVALVHGDFGFHNTLWDERRCTGLLDWEVAGFGSPLTDLAWLWWTFAFRRVPVAAWPAFVEGYGRSAFGPLGWSPVAVLDVVLRLMTRWRPGAPEVWDSRIAALRELVVPEV